jgi:VWFA-related protein
MRKLLRHTLILAFATGTLAAQAPVTPPQGAPNFRLSINLVTQDVIVRDRQGQFVADLKADDFEIYEDGVLQKIESFLLSHGGRTFNLVTLPPPPLQEGIILPPTRPTNDAAGRIFILFIDDLHMDFQNTPRLRDLVKRIKNTLIHEGDMFGIVSTGTSSISIDLTYDRSRIDEAIKKMTGGGLKPTEIIQGPESSQGPTEVRYRANVAFSTAYELMQNLDKVNNRRKAVLYISNGYDFNPFEKARAGTGDTNYFETRHGAVPPNTCDPGDSSCEAPRADPNDPTRQGQQFSDADLAHELSDLTKAANRANATIYTIDPRGLVGMPDLDDNVDPVEWQTYIRKSQDSLRVLSEETGGYAIVNMNDFNKGLQRIDNETSDYYVLG